MTTHDVHDSQLKCVVLQRPNSTRNWILPLCNPRQQESPELTIKRRRSLTTNSKSCNGQHFFSFYSYPYSFSHRRLIFGEKCGNHFTMKLITTLQSPKKLTYCHPHWNANFNAVCPAKISVISKKNIYFYILKA